jgi:hypothetical protein
MYLSGVLIYLKPRQAPLSLSEALQSAALSYG